MTHNIIAQFSCSIDKNGKPIDYPAVEGSIFSEEYNETLDSGTLILSQISKELRLALIQPYVWARVFDASSPFDSETGKYDFDNVFLVDNFNEKENNIKEHIFGYSINLMSETKILEKIQCPNIIATHKLDKDGHVVKKTIYEYIDQYMKLYVPKMKYSEDGETWEYKYLISWPKGKETVISNGSATANFDSSDLEERQHGGFTWYVLDLSIPVEGLSEEELATLEFSGWETTSTDLYDVVVNYNPGDGTFSFSALTDNPNDSGEINIRYSYERTIIEETEFFKRFNVPCADLPFNFPTLRQLLTYLMQQVGCIPTVKNRVLGFLDFQKDAVNFGNGDYSLENSVNFITRSLSSDSFANTLVNVSEQVLDSGNEVVCETLGFRDKNNVLLKQKENLKLETSFPIYKVNKCILRHPGKFSGYLGSGVGCINIYGPGEPRWPEIIYRDNYLQVVTPSSKKCVLKFNVLELGFSYSDYFKIKLKDNLVRFLGQRSNGSYYVLDVTKTFNEITLDSNNTTYEWYSWLNEPGYYAYTRTFEISDIPSEAIGFFFSGTFTNDNNETKDFTFIKFAEDDANVFYYETDGNPGNATVLSDAAFAAYTLNYAAYRKWDISKLVVEDSVRQLLERDFVKMKREIPSKDEASIDKLSKYVYGTVGYSIGSKEIAGFSEVFNVGEYAVSWLEKEYTYIENIINVIKYNYDTQESTYLLYEFFDFLNYIDVTYGEWPNWDEQAGDAFVNQIERYTFVNLDFSYYSPTENDFSENPFFSACIFDIWYQPLNSFNLAYVKSEEEIDYPLEQLDSATNGLSDFDRLSIHEQEQVDRIGNEVLSINQRTNDTSLIQNFKNGPLYFKDDTNRDSSIDSKDKGINYIIFKRSIAINNNCINVTYTGSKDAVLKNYFTSIKTKYRAYQYVDYSQSVLRKERDTLFVRISSDLYDGDNKIRLGNVGEKFYNDLSYLDYFIYDFTYESIEKKSVCYELEKGIAKVSNGLEGYTTETQAVKNSLSLISTKNMMGLIYEYTDNVGAGAYIKDITNDEDLGGIPQHWQIWGDSHNVNHAVYFVNYIDFYEKSINPTGDPDLVKEEIAKIERSPIVDDSFSYKTVFWVCDDNTDNSSGRTFYKDASERINHTVQFIYYAPKKDVLLSEYFISGTPMIGRHELPFNALFGSTDFSINSLPHEQAQDDIEINVNNISVSSYENSGVPFLRIWPQGHQVIKMCHRDEETGKITDLAVFKTDGLIEKVFYFTINDTKSDFVLADYHGILYRKYKVTTYKHPEPGITGNVPVSHLLPRTVEPIYDEED